MSFVNEGVMGLLTGVDLLVTAGVGRRVAMTVGRTVFLTDGQRVWGSGLGQVREERTVFCPHGSREKGPREGP